MFKSKNTHYQLADAELQVIHVHHVISLWPTAHEGILLLPQLKQLMSYASLNPVAS
jgi:hypothetical protein